MTQITMEDRKRCIRIKGALELLGITGKDIGEGAKPRRVGPAITQTIQGHPHHRSRTTRELIAKAIRTRCTELGMTLADVDLTPADLWEETPLKGAE
jgi:hypothetical protein